MSAIDRKPSTSVWRINKNHRIKRFMFKGIVEVDETYIGGQEKNKHAKKKLHGKWHKGKIAVSGTWSPGW